MAKYWNYMIDLKKSSGFFIHISDISKINFIKSDKYKSEQMDKYNVPIGLENVLKQIPHDCQILLSCENSQWLNNILIYVHQCRLTLTLHLPKCINEDDYNLSLSHLLSEVLQPKTLIELRIKTVSEENIDFVEEFLERLGAKPELQTIAFYISGDVNKMLFQILHIW